MANIKNRTFPLTGMSCNSCALSSQAILNQQQGVINAEVNFANSSVAVEYDQDIVSPEELKSVLEKIGFNLIIETSDNEKKN